MRFRSLLTLGVLVAGATASAFAGTVTATSGTDLILGFRASGGTGSSVNLEVNLGAISNYIGAAGTKQAVAALSAADLVSSYGSSWNTRADVLWGIVGATGNGLTGFTLYASRAVPTPGSQSDPYAARSRSTLNAAAAPINSVVAGLNGQTATANSVAAAKVASSDALSWTSYEFTTPGISFNTFDTDGIFENTTAIASGSYVASDLYKLTAGTVAYVGTFALDPSGVLWFSKNPADFASPAPLISAQPESTSVSAGAAASFTAGATGSPQPTYQWQVSTNGGGSWTNVSATSPYSGVTSATLQISAATFAMNGYQYRVVATNTSGTAASDAATLSVTLVAPSISSSPSAQTVTTGAATSFSVTASGTSPTYQWQVSTNSGSTWTALTNTSPYSGVGTATLALSTTTFAMNGYQYRAVVTNDAGTATSQAATLTVNVPPSITTPPASTTVNEGSGASFTVVGAGSPAPSYRWQVSTDSGGHWTDLGDTSAYSGTATATLAISAVTGAMDGSLYRCVLINAAGTQNSDSATLNVIVPPAITEQPAENTGVFVGGPVELTVVASGTAPLAYQWRTGAPGNATDLVDGDGISGSTTATLTLTGAATTALGARTYFVEVANAAGSAVSDIATVTVSTMQVAPTITDPVSRDVNQGGSVTFSVSISGVPTPTVQWFKDGNTISGATAVTLKLSNLQAANAGEYWAVATNGAGTATSAHAQLVVNLSPTITTQPESRSVDQGQPAAFSVVATGVPAPEFKWQVSTDGGADWTDLTDTGVYSGTATANLAISAAAGSMDGDRYRVVTSNIAGSTTSDAVTLTVIKLPATVTLGGLSATYDGAAKAATATTDPTGLTVTLTYDGDSTAPTTSGSYTVVGTIHDDNYTGTATGTLVISQATPTVTWTPPAAITYGTALSAAQLTATASIPGTIVYAPAAGTKLNAGAHTLQATFTPADTRNYTNASASLTLTVNKAALVATADDVSRGYGDANPALTISYSGFVAGDSVSALTEAPTATTTATATSAPGDYAIELAGGAAANYTITLHDGTLTVLPLDYHGYYFGTFGSGGVWALLVRADNTAEFIGYLAGHGSAIVVPATIDKTGSFSVSGTEITSTQAVTARAERVGLIQARAASSGRFTLSGQISGNAVTGTVAGPGVSLSGSLDNSSGSVAAGYYDSQALYTAQGSLYTIASPGGRAVAIIVTSSLVDGAAGQVAGNGTFSLTSSAGTTIAFSLDAANASLSVAVTPANADSPLYFSGTSDTTAHTARLTAFTAEAVNGPGEAELTVAFSVDGTGAKPALLRGVGPGLSTFDVTDPLPDPVLSVYAAGDLVASNDDWTSSVTAITNTLGVYALRSGSLDAALYSQTRFTPGAYTFRITDKQGRSGRAMAELYDAAPTNLASRLLDVTARGQVGAGGDVLVAGFTIGGTGPVTVLVRAVGPALARDEVASTLSDPKLEVYHRVDGEDTLAASNDNWGGDATLAAAFEEVGAYPLDASAKDAALLTTLAPGNYTIEISGVGDTTGIARLELYTLDEVTRADLNDQPALPEGPAITGQPASQTVTAGGSVQFSVTATGKPAPTYQWYFNGAAIKDATASTYSIAATKSADAGRYAVIATNAEGSVTSAEAVLTVQTPTTGGGGESGGSGGGGGAPSAWFLAALALLIVGRALSRRRASAAMF